jgi:hypothetical protein
MKDMCHRCPWYQEEQLGSGLPASNPTGRIMAFDLSTNQEAAVVLSDLPTDVWPR